MNTFKLYRVYYNLCHCTDEDCAILMAHDEESAKAKLYKLFRGDIHILEINVIYKLIVNLICPPKLCGNQFKLARIAYKIWGFLRTVSSVK